MFIQYFISVISIIVIALIPTLCNAKTLKIVSVVDGEIITNYELSQRMTVVRDLNNIHQLNNIEEGQFMHSVLQQMIVDKLKMQYAKNTGIVVSNDEVEEAIDHVKRNNIRYHTILVKFKKQDEFHDTILDQVRAELLWSKIIKLYVVPKIHITDDEVEKLVANDKKLSVDAAKNIIFSKQLQFLEKELFDKILNTLFVERLI